MGYEVNCKCTIYKWCDDPVLQMYAAFAYAGKNGVIPWSKVCPPTLLICLVAQLDTKLIQSTSSDTVFKISFDIVEPPTARSLKGVVPIRVSG